MHHAILSQRRPDEAQAAFYRRCAGAMARRADEQRRTGRCPEVAARLAADYAMLAALAADTSNSMHAGEE